MQNSFPWITAVHQRFFSQKYCILNFLYWSLFLIGNIVWQYKPLRFFTFASSTVLLYPSSKASYAEVTVSGSTEQPSGCPAPLTLAFWEASGLGERWRGNKGLPRLFGSKWIWKKKRKKPKPLCDMTAFWVYGILLRWHSLSAAITIRSTRRKGDGGWHTRIGSIQFGFLFLVQQDLMK